MAGYGYPGWGPSSPLFPPPDAAAPPLPPLPSEPSEPPPPLPEAHMQPAAASLAPVYPQGAHQWNLPHLQLQQHQAAAMQHGVMQHGVYPPAAYYPQHQPAAPTNFAQPFPGQPAYPGYPAPATGYVYPQHAMPGYPHVLPQGVYWDGQQYVSTQGAPAPPAMPQWHQGSAGMQHQPAFAQPAATAWPAPPNFPPSTTAASNAPPDIVSRLQPLVVGAGHVPALPFTLLLRLGWYLRKEDRLTRRFATAGHR